MYTSFQHPARQAKPIMLWAALIIIGLVYAALTNFYFRNSSRIDLEALPVPWPFYASTGVLLCGSLSMQFVNKMILKGKRGHTTFFLLTTLALASLFLNLQLVGFVWFDQDYYALGISPNATSPVTWLLFLSHIAQFAAAVFLILRVLYKHINRNYRHGTIHGLEEATVFWNFLGLCWLYVFCFLLYFQ
jgi:cytochrome c oxidase subunit III